MSYKVQSSERLRKSGADFETKAMLYLLNFREDSSQINYFVVDFFNDITGIDRKARKLWDAQSKASKNGSAKTIGRELVTLYKNHVSDFDFFTYIIFLGGVPETFRVDAKQNVFQSTNITPKALKSVLSGLKEECAKKEYIESGKITDESLEKFLDLVWFVVDDKEPKDYIKAIISNYPKLVPSDSDLIAIFNEIRNKQSEKKNTIVEGVVIDHIDEVLSYGRHLTTSEIRLLVLQRIINSNPLETEVPIPFIEIASKTPEEQRQSMIEQCQRSLCMALFNNSAAQGFWKLFEEICTLLTEHPNEDIDFIYREIDDILIDGCPNFDALSLKYFIAKIKGGLIL